MVFLSCFGTAYSKTTSAKYYDSLHIENRLKQAYCAAGRSTNLKEEDRVWSWALKESVWVHTELAREAGASLWEPKEFP